MKKILILFLFLPMIVNSQNSNDNSELIAFLIGMSNDYNGKMVVPEHSERSKLITTFFCSEKKQLELYTDSISIFFNDKQSDLLIKNNGMIELYSDKLSKELTKYYVTERTEDLFYTDSLDNEYEIHQATLKSEKFETLEMKTSFLKGVFLRYGKVLKDDKVEFHFANSVNTFDYSSKFLRELGYEILKIDSCKGITMPCHQRIVFKVDLRNKSLFADLKNTRWRIKADDKDCD